MASVADSHAGLRALSLRRAGDDALTALVLELEMLRQQYGDRDYRQLAVEAIRKVWGDYEDPAADPVLGELL